jgi:hypothetical protein
MYLDGFQDQDFQSSILFPGMKGAPPHLMGNPFSFHQPGS